VDQRRLEVVEGIAVGTASVNWGFDPLYTWVRTPSFSTMLDEMASSGYEGTEISYNFPADARLISQELARRSLKPAATFHAVNLRRPENYAAAQQSTLRVAERLRQLGSDTLILSDKPSPERIAVAGRASKADALDESGWRAMSDGLNKLGAALARQNMRAVFHPHVGTYVETEDEIERLCETTDPALLKLCPDTGHLAYAGADPEAVFSRHRDRVGYVHLKDVDPNVLRQVRDERIDFVQGVRLGMFVELGRGMVPIGRIVAALRDAGYRGWIIVEQDAPSSPFDSAKANREYLRERFGL
jgi:inosose dehydratase